MKFTNSIVLAFSALLLSKKVSADNGAAVGVLFNDIEGHLMDYYSFLQANPSVSFPTEYIGIFTEMTTYTDDSYTTLFNQFDITVVENIVTALPWYSSRLETAFEAALTEGVARSTSSIAITSSVAPSTTAASSEVSSISSVPISEVLSSISSAVSAISSGKPSTSSQAAAASSSSSATDNSSSTTVQASEGAANNLDPKSRLALLPLGFMAVAALIL